MTESNLTKSILSWLNKQPSCYAIKMTPHGTLNRGQPDIFCCHRGILIVIEVKTPKGVPTVLQLHMLDKWSKAEAKCLLVTSLEPVKLLLQDINNS